MKRLGCTFILFYSFIVTPALSSEEMVSGELESVYRTTELAKLHGLTRERRQSRIRALSCSKELNAGSVPAHCYLLNPKERLLWFEKLGVGSKEWFRFLDKLCKVRSRKISSARLVEDLLDQSSLSDQCIGHLKNRARILKYKLKGKILEIGQSM